MIISDSCVSLDFFLQKVKVKACQNSKLGLLHSLRALPMLCFIFHDLLQAMRESPNREAVFIKRLYPMYYNAIPYLLGQNVGKTKKRFPGSIFPS